MIFDPSPVRLPDVASIEAVLARLDPASVDADIIPALAAVFPGFDFSLGLVDDHYRRDSRSVIRPDGTRVGELREWMTGELAKDGGNIKALWSRLKKSDLQTTMVRDQCLRVRSDRARRQRLHPDRAWSGKRVARRAHR
jgi:hypothetical protein